MDNAEELNSNITGWTKDSLAAAKKEIKSLGIKHYPNSPNPVPLAQALKSATGKKFGLINRISYKMPRSAVFVHKGVSKGHPASNPRKAKPWFDAIDKRIDALGDIVAEGQGNLIINNLRIK